MLRLAGLVSFVLVVASCSSSSSSPTTEPAPEVDAGPAAPAVVRFIALGDTGTGTSKQQKVGNTISAFCAQRGCDFIQLLGDNIYNSGVDSVDDPLWQRRFETPYAAIEQEFWVVLGNHDYGGNGAGNEFEKGQFEVDYSQKSAKWKLPSAYWHASPPTGSGAVEMFGLDTNMILYDKADDQARDFPEWLAASTAEWKIAAGHHPYMSNGPHGNAGKYDGEKTAPGDGRHIKSFFDDHICGKVDLYLSGHDHSRQWLDASCAGTQLAVSGAGAQATELEGNNPTLFASLELGFLYIVIEGKTLTAEFIDDAGETEFTHVINKP